jgi:hypothetical protein
MEVPDDVAISSLLRRASTVALKISTDARQNAQIFLLGIPLISVRVATGTCWLPYRLRQKCGQLAATDLAEQAGEAVLWIEPCALSPTP